MRSTGRVDKLNRGKRGMRSVTISVVAVSCVSLLVFGSNTGIGAESQRVAFAVRVLGHPGSANALARAFHRGRKGDNESALYELSSGIRQSAPGQRSAYPHAAGHPRK